MVHAGRWCAPAHPAPPSHFYPHLMPYERYCLHPSTCFSTGTLHAAPITSACLPLPHRLRRLMPPGQPPCTLFSIACFTCNIPRQLNSSVASESRVLSRLHAVSCNGRHAAAGQQMQRRQAGSRAQPHSAALVGGPAQGLGATGRAQPSVGCCDCRRHRGSAQQAAGCLSLLRVMCGAARAACRCSGLPNGLCGFAPPFLHHCASPLPAQRPAQQPCTATQTGASPAAHRPRPWRPGQPCPVHAAW